MTLTVGVPKEIKTAEHRVAMTPDGVRELENAGVAVFIEAGAGADSAIVDADYRAAGATIVSSAEDAWAQQMVVKVKEPQESEFALLRDDLTLVTYLHLAAYPEVAKALLSAGTTAIAYETVQLAGGALPLLAPMDKLAFGGVVQAAGLHSLPRAAFDPDRAPDFPGPYIVKPRFGGSSIGIEITDDLSAVSALVRTSPHYRAGAVIEPYLADAVDLNISVLTHPEVRLSAIERPLRGDARIYSYADKYLGGEGMASAKRELPAVVPETVATAINDAARRVVEVALVRSVARIDFLWASDHIYVNEINTIPGSLAWYFWANEGLAFGALLAGMRARLRPHLTAVYHLVDRSLPFGRY